MYCFVFKHGAKLVLYLSELIHNHPDELTWEELDAAALLMSALQTCGHRGPPPSAAAKPELLRIISEVSRRNSTCPQEVPLAEMKGCRKAWFSLSVSVGMNLKHLLSVCGFLPWESKQAHWRTVLASGHPPLCSVQWREASIALPVAFSEGKIFTLTSEWRNQPWVSGSLMKKQNKEGSACADPPGLAALVDSSALTALPTLHGHGDERII